MSLSDSFHRKCFVTEKFPEIGVVIPKMGLMNDWNNEQTTETLSAS
jgi:hypothetical protein